MSRAWPCVLTLATWPDYVLLTQLSPSPFTAAYDKFMLRQGIADNGGRQAWPRLRQVVLVSIRT